MQLQQWLHQAGSLLSALPDNPQHEARLLLCKVLECSNSYLYTYPERKLTAAQLDTLTELLQRRCEGEPLAYIFGQWQFYGLDLAVAPCTLIPRADTEILVEHVLSLALPTDAKVLDLGTGTGAIALALASERPSWQVTAVDFHSEAVALAQQNAKALHLTNVQITQSDWFSALANEQFALIVSNPPYIEESDPHLSALRYEPLSALVAPMQGLADIQHIIQQAPAYLLADGWLWLEHGYNQADAVQALLQQAGFTQVASVKDYGNNWRITGGCWSNANSSSA